jgi:hypothetical protein
MGQPQIEAPERFFKWVGSGLTQKHKTRLKGLARDKTLAYYENP